MHHIRFVTVAVAAFIFSTVQVHAKTNPECLKHLGGGLSDADCYGGLTNDLVSENKILYSKIRKTIPKGNEHLHLLDDYMAAQNKAQEFCKLTRDASASWDSAPWGTMYPGIYAACVYDMRKAQNRYLREILKSID